MKPTRRSITKQDSAKSKRRQMARQIRQMLEARGAETLKRVQAAILEEKIESQEIRQALKHFLSYRHGFLVRPTLISLGCEAVGGKPNMVADVATPLVLMSGGMDIHDDIIDNQKTQNARQTIFGRFNADIALLAGDALLFKGLICWHRLADGRLPMETFMKMTRMLNKAFFEVGDGEALELTMETELDVDPARYLNVARKKAADIGILLQLGALLGNGSQAQIEALGGYGRSLGALWVLSDDVSDIFDFAEMKRRLTKGCLPLPIICAAENKKTRAQIEKIVSRKTMNKKNHGILIQAIMKTNALDPVKRTSTRLANDALKEIADLRGNAELKLLIQASLEPILQA